MNKLDFHPLVILNKTTYANLGSAATEKHLANLFLVSGNEAYKNRLFRKDGGLTPLGSARGKAALSDVLRNVTSVAFKILHKELSCDSIGVKGIREWVEYKKADYINSGHSNKKILNQFNGLLVILDNIHNRNFKRREPFNHNSLTTTHLHVMKGFHSASSSNELSSLASTIETASSPSTSSSPNDSPLSSIIETSEN